MEYIKVNVPRDDEDYRIGDGEGCWALVEPDVYEAYGADVLDEPGVRRPAILDNDCWAWPGLRHGTRIMIELRGELRPVVPIDWLRARSWQQHPSAPSPGETWRPFEWEQGR